MIRDETLMKTLGEFKTNLIARLIITLSEAMKTVMEKDTVYVLINLYFPKIQCYL